jgi:AcrR family transcriptional regulator
MRSIAEELGCSATALYSYFENKEAILAAARVVTLDRLSDQLEAAEAGSDDPWAQSRAVGDAYIRFAFEQPQAYRLIFALEQPELARYPELARADARSRGNMTRYVERMVQQGLLTGDPLQLAHVYWAAMHGLVVLQMSGRLGGADTPDFDTLRHETMRLITRGAAPANDQPPTRSPTQPPKR